MGTRVEYAVNLLPASSQKTSIDDEWGACLKTQPMSKEKNSSKTVTDFLDLQSSMDRIMEELQSFESIKKAILQHDNLFKQQVKELHRLYSVQKMLMAAATGYSHHESFNETSGQNLTKPGCFDLEKVAEDEAEIELTLSIGSMKNSNKRMKKPQQEEFSNKVTSDHWLLHSLSLHKT